MNFVINVADKIATVVDAPVIICGNSDYVIDFTFDSEWDGFAEKTARFKFKKDGKKRYIDVLFSGTQCNMPILLDIDMVEIGVYAGNLSTSTGARVDCEKSILCGDAENEQKVCYDRFWDEFQNNGNRTNYAYAFAGESFVNLINEIKHPIKIIDTTVNSRCCHQMFVWFNREKKEVIDFTEICKKIDFSGCKSADGLFNNACVDNITVDFSNLERLSETFRAGDGGGGITSITLTLTEKCTYIGNPFFYQTKLTNLIFTDGSVISKSIAIAQASMLSNESVQSIINALKDLTGETAEKVTFHTDVTLKLTDEQLAQIKNKNWEIG